MVTISHAVHFFEDSVICCSPSIWRTSCNISCRVGWVVINSFSFCMSLPSKQYFTFIFDRYFHWVQNSELAMFFFQCFEDIALLATGSHCLQWEICRHAYFCSSVHNSCVCVSVMCSFLWLLQYFLFITGFTKYDYTWQSAVFFIFLYLEFVEIIAPTELLFSQI